MFLIQLMMPYFHLFHQKQPGVFNQMRQKGLSHVSIGYLMSVMSQCYSIIINRGIIAPGNDKDVVDGINDVDNRYIYQLMFTV